MASPPGKANQEVQMPVTLPPMEILAPSTEVGCVCIIGLRVQRSHSCVFKSSWEISISSGFFF